MWLRSCHGDVFKMDSIIGFNSSGTVIYALLMDGKSRILTSGIYSDEHATLIKELLALLADTYTYETIGNIPYDVKEQLLKDFAHYLGKTVSYGKHPHIFLMDDVVEFTRVYNNKFLSKQEIFREGLKAAIIKSGGK